MNVSTRTFHTAQETAHSADKKTPRNEAAVCDPVSKLGNLLKDTYDGSLDRAIDLISSDDPALTPEVVVRSLREAASRHPFFDRRVGSYIEKNETSLSSRQTIKLLEILDRISDWSRTRFILIRLRTSPDPRIRSKVAKLLGRLAPSVHLIEQHLASPDARVRANAIESARLVAELRPIFREVAARDPNNRVVGNALLALFRLGEPDAVASLVRMSQHESEIFRITALWVMGETNDPQFAETLRSSFRTESGKARWMALRSLRRLTGSTPATGERDGGQAPKPRNAERDIPLTSM
jgi:HEAT repeat protein